MTAPAAGWTLADLPPRPWEEGTIAPPEMLADWLTSLDRDKLVWLLGHQQRVWAQEDTCTIKNHEVELVHLRAEVVRLTELVAKAVLGRG